MSWKRIGNSLKNSFKRAFSFSSSSIAEEEVEKVFGSDLEQVLIKERLTNINGKTDIPSIVQKCIAYLVPNYLEEEGIFRINGNMENILHYKEIIDKGLEYDFNEEENCHNIAGLLKLYIRELPSPLIPIEIQDTLITCNNISNKLEKLKKLRQGIKTLPLNHFNLLKSIIDMLHLFSKRSGKTKMTTSNLSTVWAPNLMWDKEKQNDRNMLLLYTKECNDTIKTFIKHAPYLFKERAEATVKPVLSCKKRKSVINFFVDTTPTKENKERKKMKKDDRVSNINNFEDFLTQSTYKKLKDDSKSTSENSPNVACRKTLRRSIKFNPSFKFAKQSQIN